MIDNILVIKFLSALLILQQVFWMYTVQRLVNKLMSRNYLEFVSGSKFSSNKKTSVKKDLELVDDYAANQAERANQLISF